MIVPMTLNLALENMCRKNPCLPIASGFEDSCGIKWIGYKFVIFYKDGDYTDFDMNHDHHGIDQWRFTNEEEREIYKNIKWPVIL